MRSALTSFDFWRPDACCGVVLWAASGIVSGNRRSVIYARKGFGDAAAFQTGFIYYLARATAIAANMHVLLLYAGYVWPELNAGIGKSLAIIALTATLIFVNIVGLKAAMRALDTISVLKLLPFAALIGIGYWQLDFNLESDSSMSNTLPAFDTISAGALLTLYAFIGFETVVVTSGETNSPKKPYLGP